MATSVEVPAQLDALSAAELQALVRDLAAERDELKKRKADLLSPVFAAPPSAKRVKTSPGQMLLPFVSAPKPAEQTLLPGASAPKPAEQTLLPAASARKPAAQTLLPAASAPQPAGLTPAEVRKRVTALGKRCVREIKKTAHNDKRKPYTTVTEGMPKAEALQLLGGVGTKVSSSKKMDKITLQPSEIAAWLGIEELVHPVKFDGKVWCFAGQKPQVYAWAGFESLEVKVENHMMTLKFRTFMAKTGRPGVNISDLWP